MPKEQDQQRERSPTGGEILGLIYTLLSTHCFCISPMIRCKLGSQHPGIAAFYALVMLYVMACQDSMFLGYMAVWLLVLAYRRMESRRLVNKGVIFHSRFAGEPWLAMKFTKNPKTAVDTVEPLICVAAGAILFPFSDVLGAFVMVGALTFKLSRGIEEEVVRKRVQAMNDARIEAQYYSDLMNRG